MSGCSIEVDRGEISVIVGPNGAGKSTAMKAIFGMINLREGSVILNGEDITGLAPQARVRQGMAFVPQGNNVFASLTVDENLEMGASLRRDDIRTSMEQVYELFPALKDKRRQSAGGGKVNGVAVGSTGETTRQLGSCRGDDTAAGIWRGSRHNAWPSVVGGTQAGELVARARRCSAAKGH